MSMKSIFKAFFCALTFILISAQVGAADKQMLRQEHKSLSCQTCHGVSAPTQAPANKACFTCHGSVESLVKKTSHFALNPHDSPHWGTDVPCGTCHRQHQAPRDYCAACHTNVPYRLR